MARSLFLRPVLLLVLLAVASSSAGAAGWVRVETPNFIVIGEPSEKRVREVAEQFERFRDALGRVLPGSVTRVAVPTVVVVFNSQRSFEPYRPRYNGKPVALGGYFVATTHQNLVALSIENRDHALRTVFHEYAHLIVANVSRDLPSWVNEGLAEYYSTFAVQDGGRTAIIGNPVAEHLIRLNEERLIPHADLLAVDRTSSLYNEGERRSVFYAQSWALVHMLLLGEPDRARDLGNYLALTASGEPAAAAWTRVFGALDVNAELQRYVARLTLRAIRFRFEEEIPKVRGAVSAPADAEVQATLADLLNHIDLREEGAARLEKAAAASPSAARAAGLLGMLRLEQNRDGEAERLLLDAAADSSDWLAQYHVAVGLTQLLHQTSDANVARLAGVARAALKIVLAARPDLPHALVLGGRISAKTRTELDQALADTRRARALTPGREDYAFDEVRILVERREFEHARKVLGPLLTTRYHTSVRELARSHMAQIVRVESSYKEVQEWREARSDAAAGALPAEPQPRGGVFTPLFRKLLDGEQRSNGLLERIDCSRQAIVLHLRVGETVERYAAPRFDAIEFITYRDDLPDKIECGPVAHPAPVYLTWRPSTDRAAAPVAIAVEFLPR